MPERYNSLFAFLFAIILSVALRQHIHLHNIESEMRKAEFFPLKSQFGPHFLLNTLNNIYSLTNFDVPKAQQAIQNLARLLRYMLYESPSMAVPLKKVIFFIEQYIELMKLRLNDQVEVSLNTNNITGFIHQFITFYSFSTSILNSEFI